jgi:hypothetical protein
MKRSKIYASAPHDNTVIVIDSSNNWMLFVSDKDR